MLTDDRRDNRQAIKERVPQRVGHEPFIIAQRSRLEQKLPRVDLAGLERRYELFRRSMRRVGHPETFKLKAVFDNFLFDSSGTPHYAGQKFSI